MDNYLDKRIVRSKKNLKQAFLNLLVEKPFEDISISEIARTANYNRGTFYANFHSKDALLKEIVNESLTNMLNHIRQPYRNLHTVHIKKLCPGTITLFHYFKDNEQLFKLLLSNHIQIDFRYKMAQAIEHLFIEEYEYILSDETKIQPKWLYVFRAHGITGLIIRWIEEDFYDSPHTMSEQLLDLMTVSTETFRVKIK